MILQNLIFPDEVCQFWELYYRTDGTYHSPGPYLELMPGEVLSSDTYMNVLDIGHWKKYTWLERVTLTVAAEGKFRIRCLVEAEGTEKIFFEQEYNCRTQEEISCTLPEDIREGLVYFRMEAIERTRFYSARYSTQGRQLRDIRLALDICTFHRQEQIKRNLERFSKSLFFNPESELYGKMKIYVVDNGDDFVFGDSGPGIAIFRNANRGGGTGGYARGLEEIREHYKEFPCSHTIFMDDDVEFQIEGFYRLYAFLALLRPEYETRSLAGRMFRMDQKNVQYTAVEKWNKGDIIHVAGNRDMGRRENVIEEKNQTGEYGGWWLCVYPAEISLRNDPFPFFIHCDDVEYGLRQKESVLTLRGFQVWHETYEHRLNSRMVYYDLRNTLAVNAMENAFDGPEQAVDFWKGRMDLYHNEGKQREKYLCALAMWHFGHIWVFERYQGQIPEFHMRLSEKERLVKIITPVFHRIAERYIRCNYEKIIRRYRRNREERIWQ